MKKFIKRMFLAFVLCLGIVSLASCAPKNAADAVEKMKGLGYENAFADATIATGLKYVGIENAVSYFTCSKKDKNDATIAVTALFFKTKDDAKTCEEKVKEYYQNNGKNVENFYRSGTVIYFGDAEACKDFKK